MSCNLNLFGDEALGTWHLEKPTRDLCFGETAAVDGLKWPIHCSQPTIQ